VVALRESALDVRPMTASRRDYNYVGKPMCIRLLISALLAFIDAADTSLDAMHIFLLVCHGHVIAEGW